MERRNKIAPVVENPSNTLCGHGDKDNDAHFYCGFGAAISNIAITFPVHKVMFRQQLFGIRTITSIKQLKKEGIIKLYRGLPAPMLQKSVSLSMMFGLFNHFEHKFRNQYKMGEYSSIIAAAMLAGMCESTLLPFERIQTLLLDPQHHKKFKSTPHAFSILHKYGGFKEYYRGLTAVLLRNGPTNAIYFSLRHPIKSRLPKAAESSVQNTVNDFISGACIGALCSTISFPINVVKTRMQSYVGCRYHSFYEIAILVYNERNRKILRLFRGVHTNMFRSVLSWGIINASFEFLMKNFYSK